MPSDGVGEPALERPEPLEERALSEASVIPWLPEALGAIPGLARWPAWGKLASRAAYTVAALALFILALEVLKTGASGVAPLLERISADGMTNIFGFGWLGSYVTMSGSPVAAMGLSLFSGGVISDIETFALLNGTRFGASFVVLFVGFLYYLSHRRSADGIYIGAVALLTTFTVYAPVIPLGSLVLREGWLDRAALSTPAPLVSVVDATYDPAVSLAADHLPLLLVFVLGAGLLLGSFWVFDRVLPNLEQPSLRFERISDLLHHPLSMFGLGLLITALVLSVSISLTLLVPLSLKGYVRRESIIPYVMGANISTWLDTLVAALLLNSPRASTVVFTEMALGAAVSLVLLLLLYRPYSRFILAAARTATRSRRSLAIHLGAILVVPLVLLFS